MSLGCIEAAMGRREPFMISERVALVVADAFAPTGAIQGIASDTTTTTATAVTLPVEVWPLALPLKRGIQ